MPSVTASSRLGQQLNFNTGASAAVVDAPDSIEVASGSWTPIIGDGAGAGAAPTGTVTMVTPDVSECHYTKIGNIVTVRGRFSIAFSGAGAGTFRISGLPNPPASAISNTNALLQVVDQATATTLTEDDGGTMRLVVSITAASAATDDGLFSYSYIPA